MDAISKFITSLTCLNFPSSITLPRYSKVCMERFTPVLNYKMIMPTSRIGNFLGFYFEAFACADLANINFKATSDSKLSASYVGRLREVHKLNIFISSLAITRKPSSVSLLNETFPLERRLKLYCPCVAYCHEYQSSAWRHRVDLLSDALSRAIAEVLSFGHNISADRLVSHGQRQEGLLRLNLSQDKIALPLIPDVAIQVRCSDILNGAKMAPDTYGFLPFKAYRTLIPPDSNYIYILSESNRSSTKSENDCQEIINSLLNILKTWFPNAKAIIVQRGGSIFTSMAQLMYSNVTICSSSTFCLWPALASKLTVYYPISRLVLNGSAPALADHFHWITKHKIILPRKNASGTMESISEFIHRLSE